MRFEMIGLQPYVSWKNLQTIPNQKSSIQKKNDSNLM